jgi:hypothetical protein
VIEKFQIEISSAMADVLRGATSMALHQAMTIPNFKRAMLLLLVLPSLASGQYIFWKPPAGHKPFTAIYGEIEVLADNAGVYYCGCNWWPSAKAGGYTGIQHLREKGKRIIFSIWDTGPDLHPRVTEADPRVSATRFTSEGKGAHSHMDYDWKLGRTYQFYATKRGDATGANTIVSLYFFDETQNRWALEGRILSPIGDRHSVDTFGGMLNSFLENVRDKDDKQREISKLALYRLWAGTSPDDLEPITRASGKNFWGTLNGSFFLAEGSDEAIKKVAMDNFKSGNLFQFGLNKGELTIPLKRLPAETVRALKALP